MPRERNCRSRLHVEHDFVEADLDAAFALLYAAEDNAASGDRASAQRAIDEAEKAIADGARRLETLADADRASLQIRLQRMRELIERVRSRLS